MLQFPEVRIVAIVLQALAGTLSAGLEIVSDYREFAQGLPFPEALLDR
jgi:hypothetical protein